MFDPKVSLPAGRQVCCFARQNQIQLARINLERGALLRRVLGKQNATIGEAQFGASK
jgi:hypothetical protein